MGSSVLYMSMSLDGFIAGPNDGPGNGLGDGGERLHEWLFEEHGEFVAEGANGRVIEAFMKTGAVVCGRGTFEPAGGWGGDHHDGVPIFVVTRRPDPDPGKWPNVTYLPDVADAMARAKEAAGDRDVLFHGAELARVAIRAGVLDEIEIHLVPVLLGAGRPLFAGVGAGLELVRATEGEAGMTHLRYRVAR